MEEHHMRMSGRYLQTPIRCYLHPDSGRRVWVVGTIHFGEVGYYAQLKATVAEIMKAGAVVHCEGTALGDTLNNLPPDLTPQEREVLAAEMEHGRLTDIVLGHGRWVDQFTGLGSCRPDGWHGVDLNILEIIRLAGPQVMLDSLRARIAGLDIALSSDVRRIKYRIAHWTGTRLAASGMRSPDKPTDDVVIHRRNQVALHGVDNTQEDLVLVWGTAHLPGLAQGLHARGFRPDNETWHTVGRLPSYWSLLLIAATAIPRNIRALPGNFRYAATLVDDPKPKTQPRKGVRR